VSVSKRLQDVLKLCDLECVNITMVDDNGGIARKAQNGFHERYSGVVSSRAFKQLQQPGRSHYKR
jgi:hypothetical protein